MVYSAITNYNWNILFYTNNYDWHVDHSSLLLNFYNLMSIGTRKAIMFHLNPIRGQHLTFEGGYG